MTEKQDFSHISPAPWTYHSQSRGYHQRYDWIEDANGQTVIEHVGWIDGPRICREVNAHASLKESLTNLVQSLDGLISESGGVYGLHKNGDPAPWSELTEGGQFDRWLTALDQARSFLRVLDEQGTLEEAV